MLTGHTEVGLFVVDLTYNGYLAEVNPTGTFLRPLVRYADYTTKWIRAGSPTRTKPLASATPDSKRPEVI